MIELLLEAESALSLGMLDRAEILYRQVAGADPRNSIAVVGLARVTLERGDETGALKVARRALAIDPENTAAQRMVQRLEEVLRYRGTMVSVTSAVPAPSEPQPEPANPASPTEPARSASPTEPARSAPPTEPASPALAAATAEPARSAPPTEPARSAPPTEPAPTTMAAATAPAPTAPPDSPAPTMAHAATYGTDTEPIAQPEGPPPVPAPPSRSFVDRLFRRR